jgi:hypothetical protein
MIILNIVVLFYDKKTEIEMCDESIGTPIPENVGRNGKTNFICSKKVDLLNKFKLIILLRHLRRY